MPSALNRILTYLIQLKWVAGILIVIQDQNAMKARVFNM